MSKELPSKIWLSTQESIDLSQLATKPNPEDEAAVGPFVAYVPEARCDIPRWRTVEEDGMPPDGTDCVIIFEGGELALLPSQNGDWGDWYGRDPGDRYLILSELEQLPGGGG